MRLRNGRPDPKQADASLFAIEQIVEETHFLAELHGSPEDLKQVAEKLGAVLEGGRWLRVGRAGAPVEVAQFARSKASAATRTTDTALLTLTSDLLVRDEHLRWRTALDADAIKALFGDDVQLGKSLQDSVMVHGFNGTSRLWRMPAAAIRRGSVFEVSGAGVAKLAERAAKYEWLGERTHEGFGRFRIDASLPGVTGETATSSEQKPAPDVAEEAIAATTKKWFERLERHGLFPLDAERQKDSDGAPLELSAVRRLFGYTGDNEGSARIGTGDHSQLMGRVFVNAGLEVVGENESDDTRFLKPTFLKELGMPRPSAVEHYLKQPHHPQSRPSDKATLVTYGDAVGYDAPGDLAGRKFYLDRRDAYNTDGKGLVPGPAADSSDTNKQNDRSTLALEASKPGRKFRFTVRFRDLDAAELAAILVALCPDQFKGELGGTHPDGYCSKLGYARPLGWGSVRIEAKSLLLLDEASETPRLKPEGDVATWVKNNHQKTATQDEWLAIHRRNHPNAVDYPRKDGEIYTFHTSLRAEHSRNRRYRKEGSR